MKKIIISQIVLLVVLAIFLCVSFPEALALEFEPNNIINDNEMQNFDSMSQADIEVFLNNQTGVLKNLRTKDFNGNEKSAAEIIYNASQAYLINPKWVLATLQKEQSLVTNPNPKQRDFDWAMGYAVCDSCSVDDPQVIIFKGFGTQVDRATRRIRYYYDHSEEFNFRMGKLSLVDGTDVLPFNQATANLFNYTPHLHGNYNFWNIYNRWFSKIFPDGSLLRAEGDTVVYLISGGKKRPFWSKSALSSRFSLVKVVEVSKTDLDRYEQGYPIKYANYSLLRSPAGIIYLLMNNEKKEIESSEVFKAIGYNPEEVIDVADEELAYYEDGRKITLNSMYPQGALLQDKNSGGVYYVEDGIKYPILDKEIMVANYKNYKLNKVSLEELDKYVTAANGIRFPDGTLMQAKGESKVYVVSNNQRLWIKNEFTFLQLGYKWRDIITVKEKVLILHPEGEPLDSFVTETKIATN